MGQMCKIGIHCIIYQVGAWTGSGLDILQDSCDFFGSGLDLDIYF